ncbi:MAG: hypothetical protein PHD58_00580 [Anaerolineales bacterium]|nr:hypothetical protein [Anaerolineales bacterium]
MDAPVAGLSLPEGRPVNVEGHAAYQAGVERVEVGVNAERQATIAGLFSVENLARFGYAWSSPVPTPSTLPPLLRQLAPDGLFGAIAQAGGRLLEAGASDWVVLPQRRGLLPALHPAHRGDGAAGAHRPGGRGVEAVGGYPPRRGEARSITGKLKFQHGEGLRRGLT